MDKIIYNGLALNLIEIKVLNYDMNFKILELLILFIYHFYKIKFIFKSFYIWVGKTKLFLKIQRKKYLKLSTILYWCAWHIKIYDMIFRINFDKKKKKNLFQCHVWPWNVIKKRKKEKVANTNYEREGRRTKDISVIWKNKI